MLKKFSTVILIIFVVLFLIIFFYPKKSGEVVWGSATQKCKCFGFAHTPYTLDSQQTKCYGIPYSCQYPTIRCNKDSECEGIKIAMSLQCKENEDVTNYCSGPGVCSLKCVSRVKEITVTTDKTEYKQGEILTIIITNNTNQEIYFQKGFIQPFTSLFIEQYKDGKWDTYQDAYGVAELPVDFTPNNWLRDAIILRPNEKYDYIWNSREGEHQGAELADAGEYRVKLEYFYKQAKEMSWDEFNSLRQFAYSNEFTIKE